MYEPISTLKVKFKRRLPKNTTNRQHEYYSSQITAASDCKSHFYRNNSMQHQN